jgi:hypothetical protein
MSRSPHMTSFNFADTFAHSLIRVASMVENVDHILVETFVIQRLASYR